MISKLLEYSVVEATLSSAIVRFQRIEWDGRDESGNSASSGVYFYRIHANKFSDTKKMTLIK